VPQPTDCTPIQQALGEATVAWIHYVCSLVFLLSLVAMAFVYAGRASKDKRGLLIRRLQYGCAIVMLAALVLATLGASFQVSLGGLTTPLYAGETITLLAFGLSWLMAGTDLPLEREIRQDGLTRRAPGG
jgi:hypothetical protein